MSRYVLSLCTLIIAFITTASADTADIKDGNDLISVLFAAKNSQLRESQLQRILAVSDFIILYLHNIF